MRGKGGDSRFALFRGSPPFFTLQTVFTAFGGLRVKLGRVEGPRHGFFFDNEKDD
jgi:hypothetical protein